MSERQARLAAVGVRPCSRRRWSLDVRVHPLIKVLRLLPSNRPSTPSRAVATIEPRSSTPRRYLESPTVGVTNPRVAQAGARYAGPGPAVLGAVLDRATLAPNV